MPTIKIEANVLKSILELNLLIPDDNNSYWVTAAEMRDRLVHCGVDKSLTLEMLRQAIKQVNRDGCYLIRRREGNEAYFRPAKLAFSPGTPKDQRNNVGSKRLPITPARDYFSKSTPESIAKLRLVNDALIQFDTDADVDSKRRHGGDLQRNETSK
jgi:hypothetical protein